MASSYSKKITDLESRMLQDAWLGIDYIEDDELFLPTSILSASDEDFEIRLAYLMSRPEYLSFFCKEILNIDLLPFQCLILQEMWNRKFPMLIATRGLGKSFILSVYAILRCMLIPGRKVVIVGASFRQSKVLFEYIETIWNNAPLLRSMCSSGSGPSKANDLYVMRLGESKITALPLGHDGTKIRGQRSHDTITDEMASIPVEIFENVVAGFSSVSANPIDNVRRRAALKLAEKLNLQIEEHQVTGNVPTMENQIIMSGTAFYDFNHFADYWKKHKAFINSGGDKKKLKQIFGGDVPKNFNWQQYSVIRIPYDMAPPGLMEDDQIARSKATVHSGIFQMEFEAVFTRDTEGFFKRSLLEACIANFNNLILDEEGEPIVYEAMVKGDPQKEYIFGVDTASESDNFSIVILEMNPTHRKVVYCWTTNRKKHQDFRKSGYSKDQDFYGYCAKKIRELMRKFPCSHIAMDAQGGGIAVMEALHDPDKIPKGELPIWPVIDDYKPAETDNEQGLHILEMCQFAKYEWLSGANHGMKKDFEDKVLLFPDFDGVSVAVAGAEDKINNRTHDGLETCVLEIEELKNELSTIEITRTAGGNRDHWDTPQSSIGKKKGGMKKDRYSALLMANAAARAEQRATPDPEYSFRAGFAGGNNKIPKHSNDEPLFTGPAWFTSQAYK